MRNPQLPTQMSLEEMMAIQDQHSEMGPINRRIAAYFKAQELGIGPLFEKYYDDPEMGPQLLTIAEAVGCEDPRKIAEAHSLLCEIRRKFAHELQ